MLDWMILFSLLFEVMIFSYLDWRLFRVKLTPFNILAIPYTFIIVSEFFFAELLGFVPLYMPSVLVWVLGLFLFWFGGVIAYFLTPRKALIISSSFNDRIALPAFLVVAWFALIIMSYITYDAIEQVGYNLARGQNDFQNMLGADWRGHIRTFLMLMLTYFVGIIQAKDRIVGITIFATVILLLIGQIKGLIMLPIVGGIMYRVMSKRRLSRKQLVIMAFTTLMIFICTYFVGLISFYGVDVLFDIERYVTLTLHFVNYLWSGTLALGEAMNAGISFPEEEGKIFFSPFWNVLRYFTSGERLSSEGDWHTTILPISDAAGPNVYTVFGMIYLFFGFETLILFALIYGFIMTFCFIKAICSKRYWILLGYLFFASQLFFGWFAIYTNQTYLVFGGLFGIVFSYLTAKLKGDKGGSLL